MIDDYQNAQWTHLKEVVIIDTESANFWVPNSKQFLSQKNTYDH